MRECFYHGLGMGPCNGHLTGSTCEGHHQQAIARNRREWRGVPRAGERYSAIVRGLSDAVRENVLSNQRPPLSQDRRGMAS